MVHLRLIRFFICVINISSFGHEDKTAGDLYCRLRFDGYYYIIKIMNKLFLFFILLVACFFISCSSSPKEEDNSKKLIKGVQTKAPEIADCHYTFEEAIAGTEAPESVLNQLVLLNVRYYSTDGKIHAGQVLTNKKIAETIKYMFDFMLQKHFPVAKAIPVVAYKWNDDLSMQDNNTYSFCYRDISYSKHAQGMAIDINPYFNPVRWKNGYKYRPDEPVGAVYNPKRPGTFYESSPVVLEFKKNGMRWGHTFPQKFDDHHFEK